MNINFGSTIGYSYATLQATIQAKSAANAGGTGTDFSVSVAPVTATEEPAERTVDVPEEYLGSSYNHPDLRDKE